MYMIRYHIKIQIAWFGANLEIHVKIVHIGKFLTNNEIDYSLYLCFEMYEIYLDF